MSVLQAIGANRDAFLNKLVQALEKDQRVGAVWLTGSFGRGEADEWSDLDLHLAVEDTYFPEFVSLPQELFKLAGEPRLILGITGNSNSLPGGRFWLVMYEGAIEVDWNIGPQSQAVRPEASLVLFDRIGLPVARPPLPVSREEREAQASRQLDFFWAMAPIAIKYAGRGHTRLAVHQIELLDAAYKTVWRALYRPELLEKSQYHQNRLLEKELDDTLPRLGPEITPLSTLAHIRKLCNNMKDLQPSLLELGVRIPVAHISEVEKLAEQALIIARSGGSRPYLGSRR